MFLGRQVQGDNASELDFGAVQRGDAEMEQKMNRVLRGCVESGEDNPICSLHDQGAGGNGETAEEGLRRPMNMNRTPWSSSTFLSSSPGRGAGNKMAAIISLCPSQWGQIRKWFCPLGWIRFF